MLKKTNSSEKGSPLKLIWLENLVSMEEKRLDMEDQVPNTSHAQTEARAVHVKSRTLAMASITQATASVAASRLALEGHQQAAATAATASARNIGAEGERGKGEGASIANASAFADGSSNESTEQLRIKIAQTLSSNMILSLNNSLADLPTVRVLPADSCSTVNDLRNTAESEKAAEASTMNLSSLVGLKDAPVPLHEQLRQPFAKLHHVTSQTHELQSQQDMTTSDTSTDLNRAGTPTSFDANSTTHAGANGNIYSRQQKGGRSEEAGLQRETEGTASSGSGDSELLFTWDAYEKYSAWKWKALIGRRSLFLPFVYLFLLFAWADRLALASKGYEWLLEADYQLRLSRTLPGAKPHIRLNTRKPEQFIIPWWRHLDGKEGFSPWIANFRAQVPEMFYVEVYISIFFVILHVLSFLHCMVAKKEHHMSKIWTYFVALSFVVLKICILYDFHVENLVGVLERSVGLICMFIGSSVLSNLGCDVLMILVTVVVDICLIASYILGGYTYILSCLTILFPGCFMLVFVIMSNDFELFRKYNHLKLVKTPNWVLR